MLKKYTIKDFLSYAEAFDYTEDIFRASEHNGRPISWEMAEKENEEFFEEMKKWKLKQFHDWFGFSHFDEHTGEDRLIRT